MDELKPCPWCGTEAWLYQPREEGRYYVGCRDEAGCPADGLFSGATEEEAIARWNTRASGPNTQPVQPIPDPAKRDACGNCGGGFVLFGDRYAQRGCPNCFRIEELDLTGETPQWKCRYEGKGANDEGGEG